MMRRLLIAAALLMPVAAVAQQPPPPPDRVRQERQQLQRMIVQGFMDRVSAELKLDAGQRQKLMQQMRTSGERRRELARSTNDLRVRIMSATRDSTTPDSEFRNMLAEMARLRQREEDFFKQDQDELARILSPRQQARYVFMWLRFNEQVREAALRPPPRPF